MVRVSEEGVVKMSWMAHVTGTKYRGIQRIGWHGNMKEYLERRGLAEEDAFDRNNWRRCIKTTNHLA